MASNQTRKQRNNNKKEIVFPIPETKDNLPDGYSDFIKEIKNQIVTDRTKSVLTANSRMILLYWKIGNSILLKQTEKGWGAKIIDRISFDLKKAFPDLKGFSPRNLKYMRKFADAWTDFELVQRTVALIPWRSNITLLEKINDPYLRLWYAKKTIDYGFGKDMLAFQIDSKLHKREGNSINNFDISLPPLESDLTNQLFTLVLIV